MQTYIGGLKDCHFCLVGSDALGGGEGVKASPDEPTTVLIKEFLRRGFRYVSFCMGGFRACHLQVSNTTGTPL
jgi:hypothetical protein